MTRQAAFVILLLGATSCLSQGEVDMPRYFHPRAGVAEQAASLTVRRVTAAGYLSERMMWRLSNVEVAYDDLNRWAAPPATLIEEALRGTAPGGAAVDVHVTAFEGDRTRGVALTSKPPPGASGKAIFDFSTTRVPGTRECSYSGRPSHSGSRAGSDQIRTASSIRPKPCVRLRFRRGLNPCRSSRRAHDERLHARTTN